MKYIISLPAYAKIVLHALKYPFLSVTGVLLGHYKDRNPQTSDVVEITDSVPLFHGIVLSPMLEVAMIQVDEFSKKNKWEIVGVYHAAELLESGDEIDKASIDGAIVQIADKIRSFFSSACLLRVMNSKINPKPNDIAIQVWSKQGNEWKCQRENNIIEYETKNTPELLQQYITQELHFKLSDFDNHLDDISKDWTNEKLFSLSKHER